MQCVWRSNPGVQGLSRLDSLADVSPVLVRFLGGRVLGLGCLTWLASALGLRLLIAQLAYPPLAKIRVMGDLNIVLVAQLAHAGLLAARDVGGGAGDLVDSKLFLEDVFSIRAALAGWWW